MEDAAEVQWGRLGVTPEAEEDVDIVTLLIMIHWLVTGVGCVAISPATVPKSLYKPRGSGNAGPSRGTFTQSGQKGPRGRGRGRQVRFGGLDVLYDQDGNGYPVDDAGQLYVPLDFRQAAGDSGETEVEKEKATKN